MGATKSFDQPLTSRSQDIAIPTVRLAGERLADVSPADSFVNESMKSRYSPEQLSKAPGSQYLAQGSRPSV